MRKCEDKGEKRGGKGCPGPHGVKKTFLNLKRKYMHKSYSA